MWQTKMTEHRRQLSILALTQTQFLTCMVMLLFGQLHLVAFCFSLSLPASWVGTREHRIAYLAYCTETKHGRRLGTQGWHWRWLKQIYSLFRMVLSVQLRHLARCFERGAAEVVFEKLLRQEQDWAWRLELIAGMFKMPWAFSSRTLSRNMSYMCVT